MLAVGSARVGPWRPAPSRRSGPRSTSRPRSAPRAPARHPRRGQPRRREFVATDRRIGTGNGAGVVSPAGTTSDSSTGGTGVVWYGHASVTVSGAGEAPTGDVVVTGSAADSAVPPIPVSRSEAANSAAARVMGRIIAPHTTAVRARRYLRAARSSVESAFSTSFTRHQDAVISRAQALGRYVPSMRRTGAQGRGRGDGLGGPDRLPAVPPTHRRRVVCGSRPPATDPSRRRTLVANRFERLPIGHRLVGERGVRGAGRSGRVLQGASGLVDHQVPTSIPRWRIDKDTGQLDFGPLDAVFDAAQRTIDFWSRCWHRVKVLVRTSTFKDRDWYWQHWDEPALRHRADAKAMSYAQWLDTAVGRWGGRVRWPGGADG